MSGEETALRDEELYENYLAARAGQAAEAARAAAEWLAGEPDNSDRAAAARLAQEVAQSLEADLHEQRAKINAMRKVLGSRFTPTSRATAAPSPAKPAPARPTTPVPPTATQPRVSAPPAAASQPSVPTRPAVTTEPPAAPLSAAPSLPSMSSNHKAAAALEAIKRAKAQESAATLPQPPAVSSTPPESFRAEQAARASRAVADRSAPSTSKDCPNCTASVPLATTRCRCGFTFVSNSNDLPALTLCTGDFTALRNSLKLNLGK